MHTPRRLAIATLLLGGVVVGAGAGPASAAVTATVTGTKVVVTATGPTSVTFGCDGSGNVLVSGTPTSPVLPCASLTQAQVTGDDDAQTIDGSGLDAAPFTAGPNLVANAAGGVDTVTGTARPDTLNTGPGADLLIVRASATPDGSLNSGMTLFDIDTLRFIGTDGNDTIGLSRVPNPYYPGFSNDPYIGGISWSSGGATVRTTFTSTFYAEVRGGLGNDTITVANPMHLLQPRLYGEEGDDTIDAAGQESNLHGGPGANVLSGSTGSDTFTSTSDRDTIDGRGGYDDVIDRTSARSGGRTMVPGASTYVYHLETGGDLGAVRVRPAAAGATRVTSSLNRPGQFDVGADTTTLRVVRTGTAGPTDSSLVDIVLTPGRDVHATGKPGGQDLADLTIPYGSWTRTDETGWTRVTPDAAGLKHVALEDMDEVSVHGPWTDLDEGFVHRVVRDLLFTFIDDAGRAQRTAAIKDGTTTRAGFVDAIQADDVYRYLEVDRVFLKHLNRGVDPTGRTYWINALRSGRAMWRFRAQLIGSNESFAKAGGTNAAWLARAYTDVLGRAPDPSGQAYWTNKLDQGAERGMVALQFINAAETRRRLVDDQYLRFLDRLPTAGEQRAGVALLLQNTGEQQLVRSILVGTEYYQRS